MKYLHSQQPPVIHSDLKSKNILISDKLAAKVSHYDPLYSPSTVVDKRKLYKKRKSIRCTAAQKVTTYYNIYKTDSSHSYTETKTYVVFFLIKQLGSSTPK